MLRSPGANASECILPDSLRCGEGQPWSHDLDRFVAGEVVTLSSVLTSSFPRSYNAVHSCTLHLTELDVRQNTAGGQIELIVMLVSSQLPPEIIA